MARHGILIGALAALVSLPSLFGPSLYGQTSSRLSPGTYRGSKQCFVCHQELFFDTSHRSTLQGPEAILSTTVDGQSISIFDRRAPGYSEFVAPFEAYFNPANVLYTMGGKGWMQRFVTRIVPSSGDARDPSQAVTLAESESVIMGVQWNQRQARWEDFHGPKGDGTWTSVNFNTKCIGCHTTGFQPSDKSRLDRWVESGIGCEACHGPSNEINPITIEAKQSNEICGSCHTRGLARTGGYEFPWNERLGGSFRPKESLDSFIETVSRPGDHFWVDGESKSHHQQLPDLMLGRHGAAGLTCNDCHHPHKKTFPAQLRAESNTLCLSCHVDRLVNSSDRFQHSRHTDRQASCIDCHMPRTAAAVEPGDIRSHTFFVIEPQKTREFGVPSGCVTCHTLGPGAPKTQAELEEAFREISPSFRELTLVPVAPDLARWSGFALANLGARAARLLFTLFDPEGRVFQSPEVQNPQIRTLEPGMQFAGISDTLFGTGSVGKSGWVRLTHYSPGVKGFYLEGDQAGTELTGLTTGTSTSSTWVTPVLWPAGDTRVALTNLSALDAGAVLTPMNPEGQPVGSAVELAIPGRGRKSFAARGLFPGLPEGGYVAVQSAVPLDGQATATLGKTLASVRLFRGSGGANSLTIPHAIRGDGWDTQLVFFNPMAHAVEIQLQLRRDGSSTTPYQGIIRRTIPARGMLHRALSTLVPPVFDSRVEGYMLVQTSDPSDLIQGAVAFTSPSGAMAAVNLESAGRKELTFSHIAQGNGYWTGLALFAPAGGNATLELHSPDGKTLASQNINLSTRRVATLGQILPVGVLNGGYLQLRSTNEIFGFELFGNDRNTVLASVPPQ